MQTPAEVLADGKPDDSYYTDVLMPRIDGGTLLAPFGADTKSRADLSFLRQLFELGRTAGMGWMKAHRKDVGVRPSLKITDNA